MLLFDCLCFGCLLLMVCFVWLCLLVIYFSLVLFYYALLVICLVGLFGGFDCMLHLFCDFMDVV